MKIKLKNGSTIETLDSEDKPIRGGRARLYDLLNFQYGYELTEDEERVVESFTVKSPPSFDKEYNCIWCSSKEGR